VSLLALRAVPARVMAMEEEELEAIELAQIAENFHLP
tara:strand:+ start:3614 stop:3724 length:111 start_codon:yes stop_codon:yes gene_type:complete